MDICDDSIDYLVYQTLDVLVITGWMVRVSVKNEMDDDISRRQFLMAADATVYDVKLATVSHFGTAPKEQRLFNRHTRQPVYYGPLVPQVIAFPHLGEIEFEMRKHSVDERLESLFEMVHMQCDLERDELMSMMKMSRKPCECHCGHMLSPSMNIDNVAISCSMCHFEASLTQNTYLCSDCQYALCSTCYNKDRGQTVCEDPDHGLVQMAEELGARFAGPASWFGGPGQSCGLPSINFPVEIVPRRYRCSRYEDKVKIDRTTQVLHKGVNVKILLDDDIRQMLTEAGEDWKALEIDKILLDGATVLDVMCFRSLLMRSAMWPIVEKKLHEKVYIASIGKRQPSVLFCNTMMKLCNFNTREAIFMISAVAHVDA